ncbi:MAG TPA: 50S ribosomal protein L1, partial [Bacteroidetes bacterium]|nr:50S ribosomal protein L1 [Bacteroidota bacterium]
MAKKGKRYQKALEVLGNVAMPVGLEKAIELVKQTATAKFD